MRSDLASTQDDEHHHHHETSHRRRQVNFLIWHRHVRPELARVLAGMCLREGRVGQ